METGKSLYPNNNQRHRSLAKEESASEGYQTLANVASQLRKFLDIHEDKA